MPSLPYLCSFFCLSLLPFISILLCSLSLPLCYLYCNSEITWRNMTNTQEMLQLNAAFCVVSNYVAFGCCPVTERVSLHRAVNVGFVLRTSRGDHSSRSAVPRSVWSVLYCGTFSSKCKPQNLCWYCVTVTTKRHVICVACRVTCPVWSYIPHNVGVTIFVFVTLRNDRCSFQHAYWHQRWYLCDNFLTVLRPGRTCLRLHSCTYR